MSVEGNVARRGIYNIDYFSGAQVSLYIGDVWVDEVTTLSYSVQQNRTPIYGYASTLFDDVSEGHVLVQGSFTINFKEAGYLWLILNRYNNLYGSSGPLQRWDPFENSASVHKQNVEKLVNNEFSVFERNEALQNLAEIQRASEKLDYSDNPAAVLENYTAHSVATSSLRKSQGSFRTTTAASLGGFASLSRALGKVGDAENAYEAFEDVVWGKPTSEVFANNRRADDPDLNPFDMYVAFGDFAGDNSVNHTIQRIVGVHILGTSKQIVIDGMPIQEQYSFIAKDII